MGIRPGTGSLPGCAYFLMNTRGSTTQRLNKVAKTAPAAMISITSFRSSNWILPASIPPKCYQQFNKVLILCYIPSRIATVIPAPSTVIPTKVGIQSGRERCPPPSLSPIATVIPTPSTVIPTKVGIQKCRER